MPDVLVDVDADGVMLVTLNRPETLNSLSGDMGAGLVAALGQATQDESVHAVVVTGAGRGFCSGADAVRRSQRDPEPETPATPPPARRVTMPEAFAACRVPVIAAINGPAAGAGFGISLCCDVRIMAESARLGPVFIKRGIATDTGVSFWLPRIVGIAKAYELCYDGSLLDAPAALAIGLVNCVVADDELMPQAMAYAKRIVSGPPLGYAGTRRQLLRSVGADTALAEHMAFENGIQGPLLRSDDAIEGFRSFLERREPVFKGT